MNAAVDDFRYDPFDPAVMADPLPYYRVLRERHPVYYLPKWDTFALSRFDDIWDVLAQGDGTFVASEGHAAARDRAGPSQRRTGRRSAVASVALSRRVRRADLRRRSQGAQSAVSAQAGRWLGSQDPRAGQRTARRTPAARDVRPHPGLRRDRRRLGGVRITRHSSRIRVRRAGRGERRQPRRTRQRRRHRRRPAELPRAPDPGRPAATSRHRWRVARRGRPARLPPTRRHRARRHRSRHPDAVRVHRRYRDRAQGRRARIVGVAHPSRPTGRGARRCRRQRARRTRGNDPVLRARPVVRPDGAQAVHDSRHHDRTGPADHHPARVGQPGRARIPRPGRSSSGTARSPARWPSAADSISASAITWPAWRSMFW